MQVFVSIVAGDFSPEGMEITVAANPDLLRQDLIHLHNQAVEDGGLSEDAEVIPTGSTTEEAADAIKKNLGRHVVVSTAWVLT